MLRCGMNALAMPLRSMKIQSAPGMIHSWDNPTFCRPIFTLPSHEVSGMSTAMSIQENLAPGSASSPL